jgi:imidazolonepropionase
MLRVISNARAYTPATLVSTCLAAHIKPRDFEGSPHEYLAMLVQGLLPALKNENLANRVDIFTEETAFSVPESRWYLQQAKSLGFDITIHADQFSTGGSALAVEMGAASADHLEASGQAEIQALAQSHTVAVVLPGASLGLGMHYAPARKLLDAGACVAIASDWNPGSAPMGDLLMQASVLAAAEKLTTAETFAGLTSRAAAALHLYDRGSIAPGKKAHFQAYACADFREILYHQGKMKPVQVWC